MSFVFYEDKKFHVRKDVYKPAEDSYILADNLKIKDGEKILEIGTGCGLVAIKAAKTAGNVVATDINPEALKCARENAEKHNLKNKPSFRRGKLFEPVEGEKFDLIIFNPPYLPVEPEEKLNGKITKAWDGGPDGRKIIDKFLENVKKYLKPKGKLGFVQSSLTNIQKTRKKLKEENFKIIEEITKKIFFEKLYLIKAKRN